MTCHVISFCRIYAETKLIPLRPSITWSSGSKSGDSRGTAATSSQLKLNQIQESRPCPDWSGRKRPNPKISSRRVCQQDQEGKNFHCKSVAGEKGSRRMGEKPAATYTTSTIDLDTIMPPSIKRMGSNRGLLAFRLACIFQLTSETEFLHILCHAEMSGKKICQNGPYPGSLPGLTMPLSLTKQLMQMLWVKLPQLIIHPRLCLLLWQKMQHPALAIFKFSI